MTKTIDQFMWAFQPHFRLTVEYEIQQVLSQIGFQTHDKAKVLLIGLATEDDLRHGRCIEPEDGPLVVDDLQYIEERTTKIFEADPEFGVFHSDLRLHEQRRRALVLHCRAKAIAEAIERSGKFKDLSFFVSDSAPLAGYEVHTCIGLPNESLGSVPCFKNPKKNDYHGRHIEESFLQAIVSTCLMRADKALYLPNPGEGLFVIGDRIDIVRDSATRFIQGITFALTPATYRLI